MGAKDWKKERTGWKVTKAGKVAHYFSPTPYPASFLLAACGLTYTATKLHTAEDFPHCQRCESKLPGNSSVYPGDI